MWKKIVAVIALIFAMQPEILSQQIDPFSPDSSAPALITGLHLVWNDEFNADGPPNPANWVYEHGFVRNEELQWYQPGNATCLGGVLILLGKKEQVKNPHYTPGSSDWRLQREYASYSSASIQTKGLQAWRFGRFEIRARIDTAKGAWPAIWTLGTKGHWPANGEIDIMEFYRIQSVPTILANIAWGSQQQGIATWDNGKFPLSAFTKNDPQWVRKFHSWRMDWNRDSINLYLDDILLNTCLTQTALNPDAVSPFLQPHFLLLNLAIGGNGDDPSKTSFPIRFEVDYVRVYQTDN